MTKFFSKIAGLTETAADTDFRNAAVCIPQLIGSLRQAVEGQIFQWRLTCDFLKAAETFCPADIHLPGHIFYSNIVSIMAFYILQYFLNSQLILGVRSFLRIDPAVRFLLTPSMSRESRKY